MLLCSDGSLYTGVTTDVERRVTQHNKGKGSKYVRSRTPADLVWYYRTEGRSSALRIEAKIKRLRAESKKKIAEGRLQLEDCIGDWARGGQDNSGIAVATFAISKKSDA